MHRYVAENDRDSRRTVADAIEALQTVGFKDGDHATIRIGLLGLPSNDVVGLVQLEYSPSEGEAYVAQLPTSAQFRAKRPDSSLQEDFEISRLDEAIVDVAGTVRLADGTSLRAVEVIRARLPLEPSELDWRIVKHVISIIGAEEQCTRRLREGVPSPFQDTVPDLRFIVCSRLVGLDVPALKFITSHIRERDWTLRRLSEQHISNALKKFGIRIPTARPRVRASHHGSAVI